MAIYVNPSTGKMSTTKGGGYTTPIGSYQSGGSSSSGSSSGSSGSSGSSSGGSSGSGNSGYTGPVGVVGNIQTFNDGSQLNLSTGQVVRGATSGSGGSSNSNSSGSSSQVNQLYQKYFGRNATSTESNFWTTQPTNSLESQLKSDYQAASGKSYDGSPILPGTNKTQNQLKEEIPFKEDLSDQQKETIMSLAEKELSEWTQQDKDNWNYATNNAPLPGQTTGEIGNNIDLSMYDPFINNDPFLKEQFEDETIKENFSKMSPDLQMSYLQMMQSLGKTIEAGKVINPNIEITPEKVQEFTDQATTELDPYYQEIIKDYKQDLNTSISRLKQDFETGVRNAEEPFQRNMSAVAEAEAQAGLTYGSERVKRESSNIQGQQRLIDENALLAERTAEDAYRQAERTLGSDAFGNMNIPSLSEFNVNKTGFSEAGLRNLYNPEGDRVGSLQKERTTNIAKRSDELEEAYRQRRILNTSQLTPDSYSNVPPLTAPSSPASPLTQNITPAKREFNVVHTPTSPTPDPSNFNFWSINPNSPNYKKK